MDMTPETCRAQLQALLADETSLLGQLATQLAHEHELLATNDVEGLDAAGDARQATVAALMRLEDERRGLCQLLGRSADAQGIASLLRWCDPAGSLATAQAEVTTRATCCRELNDRNGALVSARLARVSGMLRTLDPLPGTATTYAARGTAAAGAHAGRLLATQA